MREDSEESSLSSLIIIALIIAVIRGLWVKHKCAYALCGDGSRIRVHHQKTEQRFYPRNINTKIGWSSEVYFLGEAQIKF